jgi:predicted enzyme related to lactoylglutathione lyase
MARRHAISDVVFEAERERPMSRVEVNIDCADADALRAFYCEALGYEAHGFAGMYRSCVPVGDSTGPKIVFQQVPEPKTVKNRMHVCLRPTDRSRDEEIERVLGLGATLVDDRRKGERGWVVLGDPEGNEFCILTPYRPSTDSTDSTADSTAE